GDLKVFSVCCDPCYCAPNWKSAKLNPRFISIRPRLTIAGHIAARRNVARENLVNAGIHRSRPCRARFAVVMYAVATSFARYITSESTGIDHWIAPWQRWVDQPVDPIMHLRTPRRIRRPDPDHSSYAAAARRANERGEESVAAIVRRSLRHS